MRRISMTWLLLASLAACSQPTPEPAPSGNEAADGTQAPEVVQTATSNAATADQSKPADSTVQAENYTARGQEPGWLLTIADGTIDYQGNYGEKKIKVTAPSPSSTANGRRYVTERLTIEITSSHCNDAMSGRGYTDQVKVIADGETYEGCGGERRTDWDT